LRRPLELGQYTSLAFGKTLRESGLVASMGSRGDAFDTQSRIRLAPALLSVV
jgi:hypothetical protein